MKKQKNKTIYERSRVFVLSKGVCISKSKMYSIEIVSKFDDWNDDWGITLGVFETEKERDLWFMEWEKKLNAYEKNLLSEF